jgi:putative MATE family efflux protein
MRDMTKGSILGHLIHLAAFMSVSMILQTLYFLVDLWIVSSLGTAAVAGLSLAGNLMLAILALTQMLGVGTTTLIAHATGRRDPAEVKLVFNQALVLSWILGAVVTLVTFLARWHYCRALSDDAATVEQGAAYLGWFSLVLGLQFPLIAMGSALRGTGLVKPGLVVQVISVLINIVMAPVLTLGWGANFAFGVSGAAMASLLGLIVGLACMAYYLRTAQQTVAFDAAQWTPQPDVWKRMLKVGLPAGGEFALLSLYGVAVYWIIQKAGTSATAGFGIGGRVMQSVFLPVMAVSFAASPLAGQNFGARLGARVKETFRTAALLGSALMLGATLICQISPGVLISPFTKDAQVIAIASQYLAIVSWSFVASGLNFTASGMFQALGNTLPSLLCSASRIFTFLLPALGLYAAHAGAVPLRQLWMLSVASTLLQAISAITLLRREFKRKLPALA